jgi:excisionase family DNA binding protein
MVELLTTDEAAIYLRLSERKLYELVANGAVPCTKVTGKWLFPKVALDRWLAAVLHRPGRRCVPQRMAVTVPSNPAALTVDSKPLRIRSSDVTGS